MKTSMRCLVTVSLLCAFASVAGAQSSDTSSVRYPELRQALLEMYEADQTVRMEMIEKGWDNVDSLDVARQDSVDEANRVRLKEVIRRHGWPTSGMVGRDGVEAAFFIVQHADRDPGFQREMLPLVERSHESGDLSGQEVALVTDRVLVNAGEPQRYGTQAEIVEGEVVVKPIENPEEVDELRAEMGMPPLEVYLKGLREFYGLSNGKQ